MTHHISFGTAGAPTTTNGKWDPRTNIVPYDQATQIPTAESAARFGAAASSVAKDVDQVSKP